MFPCTDCAEYFVDAISRQMHMLEKHADLLLSCEVCSRLFATNSEKARHIRSTHGKLSYVSDTNGSLMYRCKVCEAEFESFVELAAHSPCSQLNGKQNAKVKSDNKVKNDLNSCYSSGAKVKRIKSETPDALLVQDADKSLSFNFLNDRQDQECRQQTADDKDLVFFVGSESLSIKDTKSALTEAGASSELMPSVDSDASNDRAENVHDRSVCSVFQADDTKRATLAQCSQSDQNLVDCELQMDMEVCEPGKSYHFSEGGESWTISRNLDDDDDVELGSDGDRTDTTEPELNLTEASFKDINTNTLVTDCSPAESANALSTSCDTQSNTSSSKNRIHNSVADSLATDTGVAANVQDNTSSVSNGGVSDDFHYDECATLSDCSTYNVCSDTSMSIASNEINSYARTAVSLNEIGSNISTSIASNEISSDLRAALSNEVSINSDAVMSTRDAYSDTNDAGRTSEVYLDVSTANSSSEMFCNSSYVVTANTVCTDTSVVSSSEEVFPVTMVTTKELYTTDSEDGSKDGSEKGQTSGNDLDCCSWCRKVFLSSRLKEHIKDCCRGLVPEDNGAQLDNVDSSCEVCDLCGEQFESFSQLKYHIKSSHAAYNESDSSRVTAASDETNDSDYCDESKHEQEVIGFTHSQAFTVKSEPFCTHECDMEAGEFNSKNNLIMEDEIKLEHKSDSETTDPNINGEVHSNDPLGVEKKSSRKRKYSKTRYTKSKSEVSECDESVLQNSISVEDCTTECRRYKTRQHIKYSALNEGPSTKQKTFPHGEGCSRDSVSKLEEDNKDQFNVCSAELGIASTETSSDSNLSQHMFSCGQCNCVLPSKLAQMMHMDKHHITPAVIPVTMVKSGTDLRLQCLQCYEAFENDQSLSAHALVAHGNGYKYYPCDVCDKVFAYPGIKSKHMALVHNMESTGLGQVIISFSNIRSSSNRNTDVVSSEDVSVRGEVYVPSSLNSQSVSGSASDCNMNDSVDKNVIAAKTDTASANTDTTSAVSDTASADSGAASENSDSASASSDSASASSSTASVYRAATSAITSVDGGTHILHSGLITSSNMKIKSSSVWPNISKVSENTPTTESNGMDRALPTYPCKFCDKQFITLIELANHATNVHRKIKFPSTPNAPFPCKFCSKTFSSLSLLSKHAIKMHKTDMPTARHACDCGKLFSTLSGLYMHRRKTCRLNRTPEKEKAVNMEKEVRVFQCRFCDYWFLSATHLRSHTNRSHPITQPLTQDKPPIPSKKLDHPRKSLDCSSLPALQCNCGQKFYSVIQLERHQRQHTLMNKQRKKKTKTV